MIRRPPRSPLFPSTTPSRSVHLHVVADDRRTGSAIDAAAAKEQLRARVAGDRAADGRPRAPAPALQLHFTAVHLHPPEIAGYLVGEGDVAVRLRAACVGGSG